jgi:hypothetical protein
MRPYPLFALVAAVSLLPACGLFDVFGDDAGDDDGQSGADGGGGNSNGVSDSNNGSDGWTDGFTGGFTSDWGTDGSPTTTGIEMTGADNDPELGCPCAPGTELIYVLSDYGALWSFDPKSAAFHFIADVDCGGMIDTFSMGVSRKARAWIQYWDGDLYTVDLNDPGDPAKCKDPGFVPGDPFFPHFGMAFVGNSGVDTCDKLYAHSGIEPELQGKGVGALGVIDPFTLELSHIAPIDYAWGELTGTGDGRLFAFQGVSPAIISEYDKTNGEVLDVLPLPGLQSDSAFAFSHWGGDFYLFTASGDFSVSSQVWHLDYDDSDGGGQALTLLVDEAPLRIVGAGVSTCAPPGPM